MSQPVTLTYTAAGAGEPVLFLHGLYGSGNNWRSIVRSFEDSHRIYTPDLRCHGRSPHAADMRYPTMAQDVLALLDEENIERAHLVGHSMGGKVAMALALLAPERVGRLMVVDIAPINYDHGREHGEIITALQALDLSRIRSREQADDALSLSIPKPQVRQFLLTNLQRQEGQWAWRLPLDIIADQLPALQAWPQQLNQTQWDGPAEFIYGGKSQYVTPSSETAIKTAFPNATTTCIEGVGHWVHAENPNAFMQKLQPFLIGKHHVRGL